MKKDPLRLLVVDADASARQWMAERILGVQGVEVTEAESAGQALERIKDQRFDAIVSDWRLPHASGFQLLRFVRSCPKLKNAGFLMLSGPRQRAETGGWRADPSEANRIRDAVRLGVDGYHFKPLEDSAFLSAVRQTLDASVARGRASGDGAILVVDDDDECRGQVATFLEDLSMGPIDEAEDGQAAWDLMAAGGPVPSVVIADWDMPRMSGYELLRAMREDVRLSTVPFVISTSQTDSEVEKVTRAGHASVDAYLLKPFRLIELKAKLTEALKRAIEARDYKRALAVGRLMLKDGHPDTAEALFEDARKMAPAKAEAYRALGECKFRQGSFREGCDYYEKAIALNPTDEAAYLDFARFVETFGFADAALQKLKDGLRAVPGSFQLATACAQLIMKAGRPATEAKPYVLRATQIKPDDEQALELKRQVQTAAKARGKPD